MTDLQDRVLQEARTWLGTPWHHEADVKAAGVDCAMLLLRVFAAVGAIPAFDPRPYPIDHMMHSGDERFLGWLNQHAAEVTEGDPQAADVIVYRVGRCYSHGAIVAKWPHIIHAFRDERAVVLSRFDVGRLANKPYKVMRIKALAVTGVGA
jgi:cell wall-associated NlpC family hydrolase